MVRRSSVGMAAPSFQLKRPSPPVPEADRALMRNRGKSTSARAATAIVGKLLCEAQPTSTTG